MDNLDRQKAGTKVTKDDASAELDGMNKLLTTMNEARAKFAKQCDKASIDAIKKIMNPQARPSDTGKVILDIICKFISADTNASFDKEGVDIFASVETLQTAIKRCDPSALEKQWIREQAESVNMSVEGVKGKLLGQISNAASTAENMPFFIYFKVLYKFCQMGMTLKTKQSLTRKQEAAKKEMDDIEGKMKTQQDIIDNLNFGEDIQAEANRMRAEEIQAIVNKKAFIGHKCNELRVHQDQNRSFQMYFHGLA